MVRSVFQFLVIAKFVPISLIFHPHDGGATFHARATRRDIPEYGILHSYRRENRKSYKWHSALDRDKSTLALTQSSCSRSIFLEVYEHSECHLS
jgi:hypothetical protein